MKTNEKPGVTTPKQRGNESNGNNPKKPGNDPDQTPEKETEEPARSKPGTQKESAQQQPKQKAGFKYPNASE